MLRLAHLRHRLLEVIRSVRLLLLLLGHERVRLICVLREAASVVHVIATLRRHVLGSWVGLLRRDLILRVLTRIVCLLLGRRHALDLVRYLLLHLEELVPHFNRQRHALLRRKHRSWLLLEILADVEEHVAFEPFDLDALFKADLKRLHLVGRIATSTVVAYVMLLLLLKRCRAVRAILDHLAVQVRLRAVVVRIESLADPLRVQDLAHLTLPLRHLVLLVALALPGFHRGVVAWWVDLLRRRRLHVAVLILHLVHQILLIPLFLQLRAVARQVAGLLRLCRLVRDVVEHVLVTVRCALVVEAVLEPHALERVVHLLDLLFVRLAA